MDIITYLSSVTNDKNIYDILTKDKLSKLSIISGKFNKFNNINVYINDYFKDKVEIICVIPLYFSEVIAFDIYGNCYILHDVFYCKVKHIYIVNDCSKIIRMKYKEMYKLNILNLVSLFKIISLMKSYYILPYSARDIDKFSDNVEKNIKIVDNIVTYCFDLKSMNKLVKYLPLLVFNEFKLFIDDFLSDNEFIHNSVSIVDDLSIDEKELNKVANKMDFNVINRDLLNTLIKDNKTMNDIIFTVLYNNNILQYEIDLIINKDNDDNTLIDKLNLSLVSKNISNQEHISLLIHHLNQSLNNNKILSDQIISKDVMINNLKLDKNKLIESNKSLFNIINNYEIDSSIVFNDDGTIEQAMNINNIKLTYLSCKTTIYIQHDIIRQFIDYFKFNNIVNNIYKYYGPDKNIYNIVSDIIEHQRLNKRKKRYCNIDENESIKKHKSDIKSQKFSDKEDKIYSDKDYKVSRKTIKYKQDDDGLASKELNFIEEYYKYQESLIT
jgi:hypothetical protein